MKRTDGITPQDDFRNFHQHVENKKPEDEILDLFIEIEGECHEAD